MLSVGVNRIVIVVRTVILFVVSSKFSRIDAFCFFIGVDNDEFVVVVG